MACRRPLLGLSLAALFSLILLLSLSSPAQAGTLHPFVKSFGPGGPGVGVFGDVEGVAVDQASGDVYVLDAEQGKLYRFDAEGKPELFVAGAHCTVEEVEVPNCIEGVGGRGGAEDELAVDSSSGPAKGDIYVANGGNVGIYGPNGSSLGAIEEEGGHPWGEPCGVAADPSGEVYVGLWPEHVSKYKPAGEPGHVEYTTSLAGLSGVCNVAVDSLGNVFADTYTGGPVTSYAESQFGPSPATGSVVDAAGFTLTVDPASDNVYVNEGNRISQYGPHGEPFEKPIGVSASSGEGAISGSFGVAINGASGTLYASSGTGGVNIYGPGIDVPDVTTGSTENLATATATVAGTVNPGGRQVTECHFEVGADTSYASPPAPCVEDPGSGSSPVAVHAHLTNLLPNTTYHYRLSATNANGTSLGGDREFTTLSPPVVRSEYAANVAVSTATVSAKVNPVGFDTTYHFEYGTSSAYGATIPVPDVDIGAGTSPDENGDVLVSQQITGLQPATAYHYRVVATNANGITAGPDRVLATFASPPAPGADTCPNARFRTGLSAGLPECRAYEMVSPLDKNGADLEGAGSNTVASVGGDRVSFASRGGFADTTGSGVIGLTQYVASRGPDGWVSRGVTPTPPRESDQILVATTQMQGFSEELDQGVLEAYDLPGLSNDAPLVSNLYREDTVNGALQTLSTPLGPQALHLQDLSQALRGYSGDLGVVTFEAQANLLPQATGENSKLYMSDHGTLRLAGVLPDGSIPAGGSQAPREPRYQEQAREAGGLVNYDGVSSAGSRVLFLSPADGSAAPQLYMRRDASNTVWVSRSEASSPDPEPQNVVFQAASHDGRRVFFSSSDRLLDSDPGGEGVGLYLYTDSPNPETESNLTFITRIQPQGETESVTGMSEDGSHVYFFTIPVPGYPVEGTYLWDNGHVHLVEAGLRAIDRSSSRVSADGRRMAFLGNGVDVYDEARGEVECASCPPTGAEATSRAQVTPAAVHPGIGFQLPFRPRYLSSDGGFVFFSTADALVPQDTNGLYDVYEYDVDTRNVALLSSGTGDTGSWFADASANGSDVFLYTRESLTTGDTDRLVDLYDVRADGGLPQPTAPPAPCLGESCQGSASAQPSFGTPTSSTLTGPGNVVAAPPTKPKSKASGNAEKLAKALKACKKKHNKRTRLSCERAARKKYPLKGSKSSRSQR